MTKIIDIVQSPEYILPYVSDKNSEMKWTFLNIYYLRELKDCYLIVRENQGKSVKFICERIALEVKPENKAWIGSGKKEGRKALEPLTALKKFGLIDSNNYIKKKVFEESILNEPLTESDKVSFKHIFFSYPRFRELMSWFISPDKSQSIVSKLDETHMINHSKPIFFFADNFRFNNTFIYELKSNTDIYKINKDSSHLMRFWDVFMKWGTTLELIEKFSLEHSDYRLVNTDNTLKLKSFSCAYFLSKDNEEFIDVISFAKTHFNSKRIYLPDLVLKICLEYRITVDTCKKIVINQGYQHKDFIGFERTSEIFVKLGDFNKKKKETFFFPTFQDSFISHLNLK